MKNIASLGLEPLRALINKTDSILLTVLGIRFLLTRLVAWFKKEHGLPTYDPAREKEHLNKLAGQGEKQKHPLPAVATIEIFSNIMSSSRAFQNVERGIVTKFDPFGKYYCNHCRWNTPGEPGKPGSTGPICSNCKLPLVPATKPLTKTHW